MRGPARTKVLTCIPKLKISKHRESNDSFMRGPGIEPGSPRWQREILTIKPSTLEFS
jgi:hypothetical protein